VSLLTYTSSNIDMTLKSGLGGGSLKTVLFESLGTVSYSRCIVTVTVSLAVTRT